MRCGSALRRGLRRTRDGIAPDQFVADHMIDHEPRVAVAFADAAQQYV